MEIIDKEEQIGKNAIKRAKQYAPSKQETGYILGYIDGYGQAESIYLKLIEEKDKEIDLFTKQIGNLGIKLHQAENEKETWLKMFHKEEKELQEAKKLLEQVILHLEDGIGNDGIKGMIEKFLNK